MEVEILRLKERVQVLEDKESVAAKQFGDDALIKGRSINEGDAAAERISDDSKEVARVLTSMDAATVLAGGIDVPTGSGSIPTAGPPAADISTDSEFVPTASPIVTSYSKRKGKEVMVESDTPKKKHVKKQKTSEEALEIEKSTKEIPEEKMKEMMQLFPVEEVYVQDLQVKHPIIDWKTQNFMHAPIEWKLYDLCGVHQVTAKDKDIFMLVEKDYSLRKGLAIVMISYKLQVETYSRIANELVLKIYKIASTLRQHGD
nr:hypothetical protein [Tanacetum cinerariifolium]